MESQNHATSYWRYNSQLSYLILFCDVILFNVFFNHFKDKIRLSNFINYSLKLILIITLIVSPFILVKKYRYDLFQPSIILIRNSNKILNSTKINENSKLFLISDNPKNKQKNIFLLFWYPNKLCN